MRVFIMISAVLMSACGPVIHSESGGPHMLPGSNCLGCHSAGSEGPNFSVAGTVYPSSFASLNDGVAGIDIFITDANDKTIRLESNQVGNFYSKEKLTLPLSARIVNSKGEELKMIGKVETGSCNSCHMLDPVNGTSGRLFHN